MVTIDSPSEIHPRRIIVRAPNWVGDIVMATPALRALRKRFPDAHLSVFMKAYGRALLDPFPHVDEILEWDDRVRFLAGVSGYYRRLFPLRQRRFDLAVVLPNSFRSAWEMRFIGARRRIGYARQGRGWLLTDAVPPPRDGRKLRIVNMVDSYLALCQRLGCTDLDPREELFTSAETDERADALLQRHGVRPGDILFGIAPGAGYGPSKLYPLNRYAFVLDRLAERYGGRGLVITSPKERALAQELSASLRHPAIIPDDPPLDLALVKSLINRCAILITNDTGPRHIAVAFDKPVVVVMGPTSSAYTDVNLEKTILVRERVECGPCQLKECPLDHRCMTRIAPERVLDAAVTLLDQHGLR